MQQIINANQCVWFDPQLLAEDPDLCFDPAYWQQADRVLGSAQGRGTTWFVRGERIEMALRHYRRGGLFGRLVSDSYWFTGWQNTRSGAEFALLDKLIQAGVRVPRPVAARAVKSGLCYRADILSERIADAKDLVGILSEQALPVKQWIDVGAMIRRLHDAQVCHTDLNSHNILLDAKQQVWIIDFDKCGEQQGDSWKAENIARLKRSFIKEQGRRGIRFDEEGWQSLLQGYHGNQ